LSLADAESDSVAPGTIAVPAESWTVGGSVSGVWMMVTVAVVSLRLALKSSAKAPSVSAAPTGVPDGMA
jgi:hypothetical protein